MNEENRMPQSIPESWNKCKNIYVNIIIIINFWNWDKIYRRSVLCTFVATVFKLCSNWHHYCYLSTTTWVPFEWKKWKMTTISHYAKWMVWWYAVQSIAVLRLYTTFVPHGYHLAMWLLCAPRCAKKARLSLTWLDTAMPNGLCNQSKLLLLTNGIQHNLLW